MCLLTIWLFSLELMWAGSSGRETEWIKDFGDEAEQISFLSFVTKQYMGQGRYLGSADGSKQLKIGFTKLPGFSM